MIKNMNFNFFIVQFVKTFIHSSNFRFQFLNFRLSNCIKIAVDVQEKQSNFLSSGSQQIYSKMNQVFWLFIPILAIHFGSSIAVDCGAGRDALIDKTGLNSANDTILFKSLDLYGLSDCKDLFIKIFLTINIFEKYRFLPIF